MTLPLREIWIRYVEWVSRNPQTTSEIESSVKWLSYFLAGRVTNSAVISELMYSVSSLVVLFNDSIIRRSQSMHNARSVDTLKTWLTVLEYSEVFIEVSASHSWGATGKWIVIVLIQVFKSVARLILLYHYKENMIQNPPVVPLKRSEVNKPVTVLPPEGFTLSSGRVIRTVESSPPMMYRSWRPPETNKDDKFAKEDAKLNQSQLMGEVMYVIKPVAHLAALRRYGPDNWKPWVLALAMDLASLKLVQSSSSLLSRRQSQELTRRQISLLLYLLRSPFYERQTRDRLQRLLLSCSDNIPLVGHLLRPLSEYIPHWQRIYFYMWSS